MIAKMIFCVLSTGIIIIVMAVIANMIDYFQFKGTRDEK